MIGKRAISFLAAAITFIGGADLLTAELPQWTCEQGAQNSFVFYGNDCPWNIAGICAVWGMTGPGTLGTCEFIGMHPDEPEFVGMYRVTCTCEA